MCRLFFFPGNRRALCSLENDDHGINSCLENYRLQHRLSLDCERALLRHAACASKIKGAIAKNCPALSTDDLLHSYEAWKCAKISGLVPQSCLGNRPKRDENPSTVSVIDSYSYRGKAGRLSHRNWLQQKLNEPRTVENVHPLGCKAQQQYPIPDPHQGANNNLTVSVVMCFRNESAILLRRSLQTLLWRTNPDLLDEIILVDDNNTEGVTADEVLAWNYPKVKVLRAPIRQGLIRSRVQGAREVLSPVTLFLDSHIEVTENFLEPLLRHMARSKPKKGRIRTVVVPYVDIVDPETGEFIPADSFLHGGVTWDLQFLWVDVPEEERGNEADPVRTPVMSGGLFAIDTQYFFEVGAYDEGMEVWGGENIEMSFRLWMCGASVYIIPCSHIGHVFREGRFLFDFPEGVSQTIGRNTKRIAEVWMDEYKRYFYDSHPGFFEKLDEGEGLDNRRRLRQDLKCHDFQWYMDNVNKHLKNRVKPLR